MITKRADPSRLRSRFRGLFGLCLIAATAFIPVAATSLAQSHRVEVDLGAQPWRYLKASPLTDPGIGGGAVNFDDSAWELVGLPHDSNAADTFINEVSGGGQGELTGNMNWYRTTLTHSADYNGKKVTVQFEGANAGAQVYVNGQFIKGTSALDPQATHVQGFLPFIVDLTPYLHFDGKDVLAVRVARIADFFNDPGFSGAFRFGQANVGIYRPVRLHVTDKVYIPENVYSGQKTWGTYVATESASETSASIRVQTNVANERGTTQVVTLTTQIVDDKGNVVASAQAQKTLSPGIPSGTTPTFDQTLTVARPTLWYPNNSVWGKPYLYKVLHTVSINGEVIDATEDTLGIRTITWDKDFPYINGHKHYLWGGSGRYDYPALGTAVPEEQKWRDLQLLAEAGGNLWRPGHSSSSSEFVAAADAYGIFIVQPSGDGENVFANPCSEAQANYQQCVDGTILKKELHRDLIVRDRSHPSILSWEANNGAMNTPLAQQLKVISQQWDSINTRAQADRTPNADNGDILSCSKAGCEPYLHTTQFPSKPSYGAEYWGLGSQRQAYDFELAFALSYLDPWTKGRKANNFGMAQWYFADSPGETIGYVEGVSNADVRSLGGSMVDANRFPRMLYYIYQANWVPYSIKPVVKLAHHWNRSGAIRVNAFSNCPSVRLLINGQQAGPDQTPNLWSSDSSADADLVNTVDPVTGNPIVANTRRGQLTTKLPAQVFWDVNWQPGTVTAQCLGTLGDVVTSDQKVTAGAADHIELDVVPELVRPDGSAFQLTANGSDAAFVVAKVVDAQGNVVPEGSDINVTFAVSGPATYMGGTQQLVTHGQGIHYHAPGDHELQFEGGLQKVALRTQFTTGTVTVTASALGLTMGRATFNIQDAAVPSTPSGPPAIIAQPVTVDVTAGQPAKFSATASGLSPLSFQWLRDGVPVSGATMALFDTAATTLQDDGASYSVVVTNALGTATSASATLHVLPAAAVIIQQAPQDQNVDAGQSAHFTVAATGSPTLTYQWLKNGNPIEGAISPMYDTPVLTAADNAALFSVAISNPISQLVSVAARLTVNAARAPVITIQPANAVINPGQPVTLSVAVDGSAPFHYRWSKDSHTVGEDAATLTIAAVQPGDAGSYVVVISNLAGQTTSNAATLKLAPPGANLALGKHTEASSVENAEGTAAKFAVDGNTETRWGSAFDESATLRVDLGSSRRFNRVVLRWESAYAAAYAIQYTDTPNDEGSWQTAYSENASLGGVEDVSFPSEKARYIRVLGTRRATVYGYSLRELEVYNGALTGDAEERYSLLDLTTVKDNLSQLEWARVPHTYTDQGAQFTQPVAANYCASQNMRLPSVGEAKAIGGANAATSAFPIQWNTWTSDFDPTDAIYAYTVSSAGDINRVVGNNFPGQALCVRGNAIPSPVITAQPLPQTAGVGRSAHFTVDANGTLPLSYEWFRNGKSVYVSASPSYDTPQARVADNDAIYSVEVTSAEGLTVVSANAMLTVNSSNSGNTPDPSLPGNDGTVGGGNPGGGNPGGGGGGDNSPGDGHNGVNLALAGHAFASSSENEAFVPAAKAFDGDLSTRWASAFEDPSWLAVDLGQTRRFDHVVLRWEQAHSIAYQLQASDDNQHWTTFYDTAANGGGVGGTERLSFAAQTARYVRIYSTARGTVYGNSLFEFEVYGAETAGLPTVLSQPAPQQVTVGDTAHFGVSLRSTVPVTYQWRRNNQVIAGATSASYGMVATLADSGARFNVVISTATGASVTSDAALLTVQAAPVVPEPPAGEGDATNLALHMPVTVSGTENATAFGGTKINDGDKRTRWASLFMDPQWVQIDLGRTKSINRVVLAWEGAFGIAYEIQVSTDQQHWTVVHHQTAGKGGTENLTFPIVQARYVRMYGTKRATQYGYSLWEMEIYGKGNSTGGDTPPTPPPAGDYTIYPGFIGTDLHNNTGGVWSDDRIYVAVIGRDPATNEFSWVKPDGSITPAKVADNDGPGHLTKDGQNYPNYFFTLAQAKLLKLPMMSSGRIFVSLGEPLYIKILNDANGKVGYAGPNPLNGTDPNINVHFDWYEFTWGDNGLWINTTQVDQFGLPLLLDVWGDNKTFHQRTGIEESGEAIYSAYTLEMPPEYLEAGKNPLRIMAPGKSTFDVGQPNGHYFDSYVEQIWNDYATRNLVVDMWNGSRRFVGRVKGTQMVFNEVNPATNANLGGHYVVGKPTTQDILEGKGTLAHGNSVELALEAQICAAFNRHIMEDSSQWATPTAWYLKAPANYYARFWHDHSIDGLAYGFAYDDVAEQSSVIISPKPEHMSLSVGW
ncbi:MAG: beta-1,3-glucanase family protein [Rhodanobacter sp.]